MKNAKNLWRILGYVLIPALFFCFGNSLRAQEVVYTGNFESSTGAGSYGEATVTLEGKTWQANSCYKSGSDFRLGASGTPSKPISTTDAYKKFASLVANSGSVIEMQWDVANVATFSFTYKTKYGTVDNIYILVSTDGGVTYTEAKKESYVTTGTTITYTHSGSGNSRYAIAIDGSGARLQLSTVEIKANASTDPYVSTEETEVSYKIQPTENLNETLSFTAGNLTSGLTISVASADEERQDAVISVDKNTVEQIATSFDLVLTTTGLEEGTYSDIITIKMGEETLSTVTVTLKVEMNYPYKKITTNDELKEGVYLIVYEDATNADKNAAAADIADGKTFIASVSVTIEEGEIEEKGTAHEFYLESTTGGWSIKDIEKDKYLKTTGSGAKMAYDATAFDWTITFDNNGVCTVTSSGEGHGVLQYNYSSPRFANYANSQKSVQLYKKQVPEEPTCDTVTASDDGWVSPTATGADIMWNAPATLPEQGYEVTLLGPAEDDEYTETVTTGTHIDWPHTLTPETEYTCKIVTLCKADLRSAPVTFTFTTSAASAPALDINSPNHNAIFTGNVEVGFTATNFDLDATHLVKAELKEQSTNQAAAPVLKTLYTQSSPLTISGLENGKYHVDLYMAEVRAKSEGSGKDTVVVGFNPANPNYVHRNFEVKLPTVYFAPSALKIKTFRGVEATDTVKVTGWALPENSTVNFTSDNPNVTVTPSSLTQEQVMATGGAKIAVTYNGADASATATITATCGTDISSPFTVNAIAKDTLANLKGIYNRVKDDTVLVRGKMVVTHKDSSANSRVWVQDIDKENGASMLLYKVTAAKGFSALKVGDVLENVAGSVDFYNNIYELIPFSKLEAVEHNHEVYVDTMSLLKVRANSTKAEAQSALVCIKDVRFKETGNFASGKSYTLLQGKDTLVFRTDYAKADYIGKTIPTYSLYATVIVGDYKGTAQVAARNLADMAEAPCLVPTDFADEVKSSEATIEWEGSAASYSVRYAKAEADLASATPATVNKKSFTARGLEAETTYYYQVKSLCSATNESEWSAVQSFTTKSAHAPAISMISPVDRPTFTDSVLVHFHLENVTLNNDTTARIVFSDGKTVENYTDTVYKYAMPSGDHSVQVILTKNNQKLEPSVETRVRYFSVDLPDVAKPEFAPKAGRYKDSVEVTLNCDTEGASIFYAQGEGEWVAYTTGSKIVLKESATLKAFACKDRMDTSAVATATYTITKSVAIEGDLVFEEYFDKVAAGTAQIADKLDENTTLPGWTGNWVYQHTGGGIVRLGKSKSLGWIETPAINLSENNGKFMVSFYAQAWKGDKDTIRVVVGDQSVIVAGLVNDKETNNTAIADLTQYVVTFDNGTAETKIKFEAITDKENNRYFLDSIRVYQVLPDVPRLSATPAMFEMKTVQGTPATQTVTVKGNRLASDVTVTCLQANNTFSVSAESLTKEAVMGENGAELTVTFNASVAEDSAKIELVSGNLHQTVMVRAFATPVVEVENIAALRAGELTNTIYKVKGEVVVTAVDGISTWVQDASAAIQIYGSTGTTYAVGDGITGIFGTLSDYHGLIELTPNGTQPAATSHDNKVEPEVMTVEELNEKGADYSSRLIRINGLTLSDSEATDGKWKGGNNYTATDEAGKEIIIRTILTKGSYVGEALPKGKFDLIVIAGYRDGDVQVSPRVKEDIIAAGGGDEDDCEAPTNLMYSGSTKITVKWNGSANEYKLALLSKDGKDTVMTKMLTVTEYTFGDEVKPNVEYGWAVASVCENGKLVWAKGQNFQIETANEEAELQADVYPNPTDGVVYIKLAESVRLEIFTLGGTVLRSEELAAGRNEIRLDRSGIYFIRLTNGTATTVRRVVVR